MADDRIPRHEQGGPPGTWTVCTLTPDGLLKEDFAAGLKVHGDLIYYDEIWDYNAFCPFPLGRILALAAVTAAAVLLPFWGAGPVAAYLLPWALLSVAWVFLWAALRRKSVHLFDFQGQELAVLHGVRGGSLDRFLEALVEQVARSRYPLQATLEGLDLGRLSLRARGRTFRASFLYDRVLFEELGPLGYGRREFYALTALRAPLSLAWRVPWPTLFPGILAALLAVPAASAGLESRGSAGPWAWGLLGASLLLLLLSALLLTVSVTVDTGGTAPFRSPPLSWWARRDRQRILAFLASVVRAADRVDLLDMEDYWEYHRAKLALLKEEGFLEEWPYRSALVRLSSQEREEMGE
ncbi:MAG: hypothetical protein ACP5VN_02390 [Acidobacteriota bacterium]